MRVVCAACHQHLGDTTEHHPDQLQHEHPCTATREEHAPAVKLKAAMEGYQTLDRITTGSCLRCGIPHTTPCLRPEDR